MQPHQQRVIDEKVELGEKLEKLLSFIQTDFYKNLPEAERELLFYQSEVMEDYFKTLEQRIELFK